MRNELGGQKRRPISLISQFTGTAIPTKLKVGDGLVSSRIGETFDAIVTGLTSRGTFVRVLKPAVEGLLAQGQQEQMLEKLRVKLIRADVQRGHIDFVRLSVRRF
jgi:RNase II-type exonuclease C-terminal S1 domain